MKNIEFLISFIFVKVQNFDKDLYEQLCDLCVFQHHQKSKNLSELCGKKTQQKFTKHDKQDTAYAPFHSAQNVCKSSPTALRNF